MKNAGVVLDILVIRYMRSKWNNGLTISIRVNDGWHVICPVWAEADSQAERGTRDLKISMS